MKTQMTPTFPALVNGGPGVTVTKGAGGVYTISIDPSVLWVPLRVVTEAGDVVVDVSEAGVAIKRLVAAPTNVLLPLSAARTGGPVSVKDAAGNAATYPITVIPNAANTPPAGGATGIDGHVNDIIDTDFGARTYMPVTGGWLRS